MRGHMDQAAVLAAALDKVDPDPKHIDALSIEGVGGAVEVCETYPGQTRVTLWTTSVFAASLSAAGCRDLAATLLARADLNDRADLIDPPLQP